ncbi:MAG: TolC family protein [Clostridia bacterium]|nr:TolC family protein [Clostridia bacterium]
MHLAGRTRSFASHILIICCVVLAAASAGAACLAGPANAAASSGVNALPLGAAVEMSLAHSNAIRSAALNLKQAELAHQRASAQNLSEQSVYAEHDAGFALEEARAAYRSSAARVISDTISCCFDLRLAELNMAAKELRLRVAMDYFSQVQSRAKARIAGPLELASAEAASASARLEAEWARDSLDEASAHLARFTGLARDAQLQVVDVIQELPRRIDVDAEIAGAMAHSLDLRQRQNALSLAELKLEGVLAAGSPLLDLKAAEIRVELARLALREVSDLLEGKVVSACNAVLRSKADVRVHEISLDLERKRLQVITGQAAAGLASASDVTSSQATVIEAEYSLLAAAKAHVLNQLELIRIVGDSAESAVADLLAPKAQGGV